MSRLAPSPRRQKYAASGWNQHQSKAVMNSASAEIARLKLYFGPAKQKTVVPFCFCPATQTVPSPHCPVYPSLRMPPSQLETMKTSSSWTPVRTRKWSFPRCESSGSVGTWQVFCWLDSSVNRLQYGHQVHSENANDFSPFTFTTPDMPWNLPVVALETCEDIANVFSESVPSHRTHTGRPSKSMSFRHLVWYSDSNTLEKYQFSGNLCFTRPMEEWSDLNHTFNLASFTEHGLCKTTALVFLVLVSRSKYLTNSNGDPNALLSTVVSCVLVSTGSNWKNKHNNSFRSMSK